MLNLPDVSGVAAVDALAMLTGSSAVPLHKRMLGYRYAPDKFACSGLTPQPSLEVRPSRISECPIQLEARLVSMRSFAKDDQRMAVPACAIEVRIVRAHVEENLLDSPQGRRIDPDKWRPLIMSFRGFYGLGESLHPSKLAKGSESAYAPWRSGGVRKMVGMVYRHWAHRQYRGDVEVPAEIADEDGSRRL